MKNCPYCKIDVGGSNKKCPFCQSTLVGTAEEPYFASHTALKIKSLFYKFQMFIIWSIVIAAVGADFLLGINLIFDFHWSLLLSMWMISTEFCIIRLFKKGTSPSRVLTILAFAFQILLLITAYYLDCVMPVIKYVIPSIVMATMIVNYILALVDKSSNAMIYLLSNVFVGALPYVAFFVLKSEIPIAWIVSLILSVILFVGAIIFKGRAVLQEIHRRFNL